MTEQEYKAELEALKVEFENKKREIAKQFAFSNNPYKIGDIVTDRIGSLKIEKINYTSSGGLISDFPMCVYCGIELTKKGEPQKKQTGRKVWQCSIIK